MRSETEAVGGRHRERLAKSTVRLGLRKRNLQNHFATTDERVETGGVVEGTKLEDEQGMLLKSCFYLP